MNNGPYCRPIELLQEYKHGARQNRLEGIEARKKKKNKAQKKSFSPRPEEKKTQPTEPSYFITSGHYSARPQSGVCSAREMSPLIFICVFSLFSCGEKKKLAQWRRRELFLWTAAAVLQSHHKSRDPPWGELASSLLSQPLFSTKHD